MRRSLTILAVAALAFSAVAAEGEGDPTTELPDPIDMALYMHGGSDTAYADEDAYLDGIKEMDTTAPEGDFESMQLLNYVGGPNPNCAGNALFPVWSGFLSDGSVVGDAVVTFDVVGANGGDVTVNLWKDVTGQACNDAYPTPTASVDVTLPVGNGTVEAALPTDGLELGFSVMIQIQPAAGSLAQGRVLYDGADYATSLTLTCQPAADDDNANCLPF